MRKNSGAADYGLGAGPLPPFSHPASRLGQWLEHPLYMTTALRPPAILQLCSDTASPKHTRPPMHPLTPRPPPSPPRLMSFLAVMACTSPGSRLGQACGQSHLAIPAMAMATAVRSLEWESERPACGRGGRQPRCQGTLAADACPPCRSDAHPAPGPHTHMPKSAAEGCALLWPYLLSTLSHNPCPRCACAFTPSPPPPPPPRPAPAPAAAPVWWPSPPPPPAAPGSAATQRSSAP